MKLNAENAYCWQKETLSATNGGDSPDTGDFAECPLGLTIAE
jgi:hypothetical protein